MCRCAVYSVAKIQTELLARRLRIQPFSRSEKYVFLPVKSGSARSDNITRSERQAEIRVTCRNNRGMQGEKIDERDGTKATTVVKGIRRRRKKTNARGKSANLYFTHWMCIANDPSGKVFFYLCFVRNEKKKIGWMICILIFVIDFWNVDSRNRTTKVDVQKFWSRLILSSYKEFNNQALIDILIYQIRISKFQNI